MPRCMREIWRQTLKETPVGT
uniref:Uncharacterized protein n=1 Tax=Anguilla anguilla TaxID=7936 RepID=A0A0E9UIC7_ANGAN